MKKSLNWLLIGFGLLAACEPAAETPLAVMTKVRDNYGKHASMSYTISCKLKYFDETDTLALGANCQLVRERADTLFGGRIWFFVNDTTETYYDLKTIYCLDHFTKKIMECNAAEDNGSLIYGSAGSNVIKVGFLHPEKLVANVADTANRVTLKTEKEHYRITVKYPDRDGFSGIEYTYHIKKGDFVIDKISYTIKFQGNFQYNEWSLSGVEFDNVSVNKLDASVQLCKKSYIRQQYPLPEIPILPVGTTAPAFTGKDLQSGKPLSLNDYKGKFIILDFSYMSCYPCVMAIPYLNAIQQEYKNKDVVVLYINSKDNTEQDKKRLHEFIKKHAITYKVIMTGNKTDSAYQVTGYPTLYAINKKGKIVYAELGFSGTLEDSLKAVISRQ